MSEITTVEIELSDDEDDSLAQTIAEKMQIAKNVVTYCERTQNSPIGRYSSHVEKIIAFTGVVEETVEMLDETLKTAETFTEWCDEKYLRETTAQFLPFFKIRRLMFDLYTKRDQVVTKEKLINNLYHKYYYMARHSEARLVKDIFRHGFTWKCLAGKKKSIIVERSDQCLKRMEYLRKMMAYREIGRSIIYVDAFFQYYQFIVSPQHGLLHMGYHGVKKDNVKRLNMWAKHTLAAVLPPKSVVVVKEDPQYAKKTPTPYTSKSDMIGWLKERKVPHDSCLHKADLYALIKKNKQPNDSNEIVYGFLKNHGHDVVYRPNNLTSRDYFEVMWACSSTPCKEETLNNIKQNTLQNWQHHEEVLMSEETKIYQEDLLLESVLDKLFTFAKYGELSRDDVEVRDDQHRDEDYYDSIILD